MGWQCCFLLIIYSIFVTLLRLMPPLNLYKGMCLIDYVLMSSTFLKQLMLPKFILSLKTLPYHICHWFLGLLFGIVTHSYSCVLFSLNFIKYSNSELCPMSFFKVSLIEICHPVSHLMLQCMVGWPQQNLQAFLSP